MEKKQISFDFTAKNPIFTKKFLAYSPGDFLDLNQTDLHRSEASSRYKSYGEEGFTVLATRFDRIQKKITFRLLSKRYTLFAKIQTCPKTDHITYFINGT